MARGNVSTEKAMISIKDIARKANVSVTTVSRIVNKSPAVKDSTRRKVLKIIEDLHYTPNLHARSLITGRTRMLTLLMQPGPGYFSSHYYTQILNGVSEAISRSSYRLTLYQPEGYDHRFGYAPKLDEFPSDGIFMVAPLKEDRLVKYLESRGKPAVLISGRSQVLDWVDINSAESSVESVDALIRMGHRRIGFIGGGCDDFNTQARQRGYQSALEKAGLPVDPALTAFSDYTTDGGAEAGQRLWSLAKRPTAIFCVNDSVALGALRAAQAQGLSVPEDVSIIGYDDVPLSSLMRPSLSTVRQPLAEMGRRACEFLIARVESPRRPQQSQEFKAPVIMRGSCAPPGR
jgi:LacI family transcriptional regulator